jgi:hypothetical protein
MITLSSATFLSAFAPMAGVAGWALVLLWLGVRLIWMVTRPGRWLPAVLVGLVFAVGVIPLALLLRSSFGDLSGTTVFLALWSIWHHAAHAIRPHRRSRVERYGGLETRLQVWTRGLAVTIATTGAVLYGSALGPVDWDLYAWGWMRREGLVLLALVALVSLDARHRRSVFYLALPAACLGYGLGLTTSSNLWDALIDPWLWLVSIGMLLWPGAIRHRPGEYDDGLQLGLKMPSPVAAASSSPAKGDKPV